MPKQDTPQGIYLGFDFGSKKIGVASGQTVTQTANPLYNISIPISGIPWDKFDDLIKTWRPCGLVVGLPINADGTQSDTSLKAMAFCRLLEKRYHLPVFNIDEHLSTFEARQQFKEYKSRGKVSFEVDAIAAAIILTSWFKR